MMLVNTQKSVSTAVLAGRITSSSNRWKVSAAIGLIKTLAEHCVRWTT